MANQRLAGAAIVGMMVVAPGCASSPDTRSSGECVLAAADSAMAARLPLYLDCSVDAPAKALADRLHFTPPPRRSSPSRPGTTCYAAEVQFVVGVDGRPEPETIRLVRSVPDEFSRAVLASVPGWVYSPAMLDGTPVRQLVRERRTAVFVVTVSSTSQGRPPRPPVPPPCR